MAIMEFYRKTCPKIQKFIQMRTLLFFVAIVCIGACSPIIYPDNEPSQTQPIQVTPLMPGPINPNIVKDTVKKVPDPKLQAPSISPAGGKLSYGSTINLKTTEANASIEYSTDNGKIWIKGDNLFMRKGGAVLARTRVNDRVSDIIKQDFEMSYKRVVIFGNSITYHPPAPTIGWNGNWGMAASAADKDYLHFVRTKLSEANPSVVIKLANGGAFELGYATYDWNSLKEFEDFQPDLIIMRISENVVYNSSNLNAHKEYGEALDKLVTRLQNKRPVNVILTSGFFSEQIRAGAEYLNFETQAVVQRHIDMGDEGYHFAQIDKLASDPTNSALGLFKDKGVGFHPSDKGMKGIADLLIKEMQF
jgi:hypothetical protein